MTTGFFLRLQLLALIVPACTDAGVVNTGDVARINMNNRTDEYGIAVKSGQPLKFTVGVKHLCIHADMVTFEIDDAQADKKTSFGLHFLWRQIGGKFEVHQSDRAPTSNAIIFDWNVGGPKDETKAVVTVAKGRVTVEHDKKTHSEDFCSGARTACSFYSEPCKGEDVFYLTFTNIDDRKCGLFLELDKNDARLLSKDEEKSCPKKSPTTTSSTKKSPTVQYSGLCMFACLAAVFFWH